MRLVDRNSEDATDSRLRLLSQQNQNTIILGSANIASRNVELDVLISRAFEIALQ